MRRRTTKPTAGRKPAMAAAASSTQTFVSLSAGPCVLLHRL